jgi:hypothetical protein
MSEEDGFTALAEELSGLAAGKELRLSYDDFSVLFPAAIYGAAFHVGRPGHWATDLARKHGCIVRNERDAGAIVFKKIPIPDLKN